MRGVRVVLPQLLHVSGQTGHLPGGFVRPARVSRAGIWPGDDDPSRAAGPGTRLRALRVGGFELEPAVARFLPFDWRVANERLDNPARRWRGAGTVGATKNAW